MKLWERVVEARLRREATISEQQYGFMPRKTTTDAMFCFDECWKDRKNCIVFLWTWKKGSKRRAVILHEQDKLETADPLWRPLMGAAERKKKKRKKKIDRATLLSPLSTEHVRRVQY